MFWINWPFIQGDPGIGSSSRDPAKDKAVWKMDGWMFCFKQ